MFKFNKREIVDGYRIIRDSETPYICYTAPYWWERIGGFRDKMFHDVNHPEYHKMILELSEKCKKIKITK